MEDGTVSELDLKLAGPSDHTVPSEQAQDNWEEIEQHYDDISGKLLPQEFGRDGRAEEIRWCEPIKLCDKVPRQKAIERGIEPAPVRWVDVNK